MIKAMRVWWLFGLCVLSLAINIVTLLPWVQEWWKPVIDVVGGNMTQMPVDREVYRCGDLVHGRFIFQKQRGLRGEIKWQLVKSLDERVYLYPPRTASAPVGIISHWAEIERIPKVCEPGKYHFEGTLTYSLGFGIVTSYALRTECFRIE